MKEGDRHLGVNILQEQIDYYRQRAPEYDEWFLRQGRYDRGEVSKQQWSLEVSQVEKALKDVAPSGDILELACGTGLWTQKLAPLAASLLAVDASPEAIALNRQRIVLDSVKYEVADLFNWQPTRKFDFIFFSFWLSHIPQDKFTDFWEMVKSAVNPHGRVFFVDSLLHQDSTAKNHAPLHRKGYSERELNDGRRYRVIKIFYEPGQLEQSLQDLGWLGSVERTDKYFLYGCFSFDYA